MARRDFVPTKFPLVNVVTEPDPIAPLKSRTVGYVTSAWRRFNESVATAIAPGSSGEVYTSNGVSAVWALLTNTNIAVGAAIAYAKLNLALSIVNADIAVLAAIDWSKISKSGSSLADLATRSATDLTSGTLNAARLPTAAVQSTNSKVTAAAPYTNDGYIEATINGVTVRLMTTA